MIEKKLREAPLMTPSTTLDRKIEALIHDSAASIRVKAASSAGFFHQVRSLFMTNAVLKFASAAAVLAIIFIIAFWIGGSPSTIVWADVQERLNQVHTMIYSSFGDISEPTGMRITGRVKVYYKDPGLARTEEYPPDSSPGSGDEKPKKIIIVRWESGSMRSLILYPESDRADLSESVFLTDGPKPPSMPPIDHASFNWEIMKEITADKARQIGDRVINGIHAVGFEFEMPYWTYENPDGKARAQLWASGYDGTPLLVEVGYRDSQGQNMHREWSDFRWNAPLDESLFDFAVPEGWNLSRVRTEAAVYANAELAPGVTLQIGPDGRAPLTGTEDVVRVVRGDQGALLDSEVPPAVRVVVELKPEAMQRLRDYAGAHPNELIIVDFNRQLKVMANLYGDSRSQLYFDLSLLDLPLAELEKKYFTTSIERNGL